MGFPRAVNNATFYTERALAAANMRLVRIRHVVRGEASRARIVRRALGIAAETKRAQAERRVRVGAEDRCVVGQRAVVEASRHRSPRAAQTAASPRHSRRSPTRLCASKPGQRVIVGEPAAAFFEQRGGVALPFEQMPGQMQVRQAVAGRPRALFAHHRDALPPCGLGAGQGRPVRRASSPGAPSCRHAPARVRSRSRSSGRSRAALRLQVGVPVVLERDRARANAQPLALRATRQSRHQALVDDAVEAQVGAVAKQPVLPIARVAGARPQAHRVARAVRASASSLSTAARSKATTCSSASM